MKTNAVYLGNCMELIRDLPKDREIVLVTDPPFNIGYHYGQYDDDMDEADYYKMLKALYDAVGGKAVFIHYPEALHRLSIELKAPPHGWSLGFTIPTPQGSTATFATMAFPQIWRRSRRNTKTRMMPVSRNEWNAA